MAILKDAVSAGTVTSGQTISWSHTCAAVTLDTILLVIVGYSRITTQVSTLTYNGVSLTTLSSNPVQASNCGVEMWWIKAPTAGSNTIAVTMTNANATNLEACAVSYTGAYQASPVDTNTSLTGTAATVTKSITTAGRGEVIVGGYYSNPLSGWALGTVNSPTRLLQSSSDGTQHSLLLGDNTAPQIGTNSISFNDSSTQPFWSLIEAALTPVQNSNFLVFM
jgi:hypothetical protein